MDDYEEEFVPSGSANIKSNHISSLEDEITKSHKEKKTSRKRKKRKDVKQGELSSNDEDKPDSKKAGKIKEI